MKTFIRILVVCLLAVTTGSIYSQNSSTGNIRGTVTDATGAVVSGATVTVVNIDTGVTKVFTTNSSGLYDTVSTPTGKYNVTFSATGFEQLVRGPIIVDVGGTTLNGKLTVGSAQEQVVVTGDNTNLLQTESGEQSTTLDNKTMLELPQVGADWANFTILLPGGAGAPSTGNAVTNPGVSISLNGGMPFSSNFLADGGTVTNPHSSDVETSTFETVSEVQIDDSNFSAQYGIGGAVFNQITKGGTNNFHGSLYEFFQNNILNARSFFDPPDQPTPFNHFNNFGGSVGGPLHRNKMFFYFNYDQTISKSTYNGYADVPSDQMKGIGTPNGGYDLTQLYLRDGQGNKQLVMDPNNPNQPYINPCTNSPVYQGEIFDPATQTTVNGQLCRFPFAQDNVIPAGRIDAVAKNLLALYPSPNQNTALGVNGDYYFAIPYDGPSTKYFGRIDYDITPTNRITSSIAVRDSNQPVPDVLPCPTNCYHDDTSDYSSQTSDVWSVSSTFVNEFRFSFNRQGSFLTPYSLGEGYPQKLGLQYAKADVIPNINIGDTLCCYGIYAGTNTIYAQNIYQPSDVVTLIRGKHVLHFGGEFIMMQDNSTPWGNVDAGDFNFYGAYTQAALDASGSGAGMGDFLLGLSQGWGAANTPLFGGRQKSPQVFVQDDIKLKPNLTVNAGLRYQVQIGWKEVLNRMGDFDPTVVNPEDGSLGAMWFAPANHRTQAQENVYTGLLPRIGFAYTLPHDPSTVLRGGWGIYTTPWSVDQYGNAKGTGYGQSGNISDDTNGATPTNKLDGPGVIYGTNTPLPYLNAARGPGDYNHQSVNYDDYHTPISRMYQWSLGIQHEFTQGITAEISYVASHGSNLQFKGDLNQVPEDKLGVNDLPNGRPYPLFESINGSTFNGRSNYNSLQAQIKKRLGNGLSFSSAYTWSKFLNTMDVSAFNGQGGSINYQNFHNPDSNYAPSNFDIRNTLKSSVIYELPFGMGKTFFNHNRILDLAIGGWRASAIVINQGGNPFTLTYSQDNLSYSRAGSWYPNRVSPDVYGHRSVLGTWYNPAAFATATPGTFGNFRRNTLYGPGVDATNFSLGKTFHIREGMGMQVRGDANNVFNHPSFSSPNGNFDIPNSVNSSGRAQGAGTISGTTVGGRLMQVSARFSF